MAVKKKKRKRDYKKEYRATQGKGSKQIKNRAKRNAARRRAMRLGLVRKGDRREVDHLTPLSRGGSNRRSNTRIVSRKKNRSRQPKRKPGRRKKK